MGDVIESKRYAAAGDGVIHEVVDADFRSRRAVYIARCGRRIEARNAEVKRARDEPGVICAACRHAVDAVDTTA